MADKKLLLAIETAAGNCSVSLYDGGRMIALQEIYVEKSHSAVLAVMIKNLIDNTGRKMAGLSAIAVSMGPGSYTGLRIGTSTAKGICYALKIPLIAVNSLEALAFQLKDLKPADHYLCPMFDARRMEVYYMLLDHGMKVIHPAEAAILDENSFSRQLEEHKILFFGDGMPKFRPLLSGKLNAGFIDNMIPSAATIGLLGFEKLQKKEFENTVTFEPYYLKEYKTTVPKNKFQK